jgi:RNA polymerase sigma-70 factor, ECF subfamily
VELSDEVLCRRVADGNERAFDELVERHQRRAYRVAWSILGDAEEARDLSQEAFLRLYERAASFDGRSKFTTWFHRILVNLCLDHRRKRQGWLRRLLGASVARDAADAADPVALLEELPGPAVDPGDAIDRQRTMSRLWKAAERLSAQQRAALVLQVEEDLSTAEIARVLDCSEATVRVHLHRAISALRKTMASETR